MPGSVSLHVWSREVMFVIKPLGLFLPLLKDKSNRCFALSALSGRALL